MQWHGGQGQLKAAGESFGSLLGARAVLSARGASGASGASGADSVFADGVFADDVFADGVSMECVRERFSALLIIE